ncbi:DUF6916 family protein [Puniceibacterium sediminis]|uniref:DUF6916 family protein n=1 Tax=Puniceibacterium sediminis TaxID=1608407 RepID=UPI001FE61228|nr:hypothetical protein [Puniceibacterium sediminis]
MIDLNAMTAEDFALIEGMEFMIVSVEPAVRLKLIEVRKLGAGERKGGAFSLLWQGPPHPVLPQATYQMSQDTIGSHDIFLVPVSWKDAGVEYEAIFT